jgi:hypothetical protein
MVDSLATGLETGSAAAHHAAVIRLRASTNALVVSALLFAAASARAETRIRTLSAIIEGHSVGGVAIDAIGNIYVADFGEVVWKLTLEGERREFASGLYGASGNAIDKQGNLLQSSFYGDSITLFSTR